VSQKPWIAKTHPWEPADYDDQVIYAVRALEKGVANDGQQKLFWAWLQYMTGADDLSFRPGEGGERATSFAEGKRFVGQQVRKMTSPLLNPKPLNVPDPPPALPSRKKQRARNPA
jgi:hypothetical protein